MQKCLFFDAEQMMQEECGIVAPLGMQNSDEVFAFYCAALSFPGYFGWNWDAFDECIHDLYWIDGTTIHIVHPDIPLRNDLDKRAILLSSIYEIKFYSRTKGKLAIHFKMSDKREVQDSIVQFYVGRGFFQEKLFGKRFEWYGAAQNSADNIEKTLNAIDKNMIATYVEMGFLDESELDVVKDTP